LVLNQITMCHMSENCGLNTYRCENVRSCWCCNNILALLWNVILTDCVSPFCWGYATHGPGWHSSKYHSHNFCLAWCCLHAVAAPSSALKTLRSIF
jgi:hypothetical protein